MFSCQLKYKKKYQALLNIIYVPKNWNLFKIQWWHLISFSGICRYLFWTSFYIHDFVFSDQSRNIPKWNLYVANSKDLNSNKNMWQLSEFNAGWCILQKWHQSTTDKNYSFSFISIRPIYSTWGVYLLPYWEDGGLSQPHNDMRDACRPLKNVKSWRSRDAWNWNVL